LHIQCTGFQLDYLPHTQVEVHGCEYFFAGSDIDVSGVCVVPAVSKLAQVEPDAQGQNFNNLPVYRTIDMGRTEINIETLNEWSEQIGRSTFQFDSIELSIDFAQRAKL